MDKKKNYQAIIFFIIGAVLFWYVFRNTNWQNLVNEIYQFHWGWILLSILLNLVSQWMRAMRWKLLFVPMKYNPKTYNLFFSFLILAFTNQVIPRGGEIARLGAVNKYENVPVSKLLGTALIERLTDLVILILIFFAILVWQLPLIKQVLSIPEIDFKTIDYQKFIIISTIVIASLFLLYFLAKKLNLFKKFKDKIAKAKEELMEGFKSILHIKNKLLYFTESILIYAVWLIMLYVLFFAYPATEELSFKAAAFTFGLATLAFLIPIQAGMGAWHFVVVQCLLLFGVAEESGKAFALVAHSVTNHVYLFTGLFAFVLLPLFNGQKQKSHNK